MCWRICGSEAPKGVASECMGFARHRSWWPRPVSPSRSISYPHKILTETFRVRADDKDVAYFFRAASMQDATAFLTGNHTVAKLLKRFRIDGFKVVGSRRACIGLTLTRSLFGSDCHEGRFGSSVALPAQASLRRPCLRLGLYPTLSSISPFRVLAPRLIMPSACI